MASFRRTEYGYAQKKWVQPAAAVVAAGSAAVAALALFAAATVQPVDAVYAVWMVVVCVLMARTALLKVEVRREGVHVVNPWRTDFNPPGLTSLASPASGGSSCIRESSSSSDALAVPYPCSFSWGAASSSAATTLG